MAASNRRKCAQCGLVNTADDVACRRCHALLPEALAITDYSAEAVTARPQRGFWRRLTWIVVTSSSLLFIFYMSLLLTSRELGLEQRQSIRDAVSILEQKGFHQQASLLSHLAQYRDTDNWWNRTLGHNDAYAATNFPFEVVTVYPEFFTTPVDDTERAVILLHEACHLAGKGEKSALEMVWRHKQQLGWTADKYGNTKVWINTRSLTIANAPELFTCGDDGHSDCNP